MLPLVPTCYIGAWTLCGMPTVFAIQDDLSPLITESAGIYTCVIAVIQSGAMMHLVLNRDSLAIYGPKKKTG